MFENVTARPRRRGALAVSISLHLALGGTVWVRPLLATPEPPEVPDKPIVWVLPAPEQPIDVTLVQAARPKGGGGGGGAPRPLNQRSRPARPAVVQPTEIPEETPEPGQDVPAEDGPFDDTQLPSDSPGQPGLPVGPGSETGPISISDLGQRPDVTMPLALETPDPVYPEVARRVHVQGQVVLEAIIGADGLIRDARVIRSANPLLDRAATEAVLRWRYRPARIGSRPVSVYLSVVLTFSLRS